MSKPKKTPVKDLITKISTSKPGQFITLASAYFLVELFSFFLLGPKTLFPLVFGLFWSLLLTSLLLLLPQKAGRILFAVTWCLYFLWAMTQAGYYHVFGKLMWLSTLLYAGEGAQFIGDVLIGFPLVWWLLGILIGTLGVSLIRYYHILTANAPSRPLSFLWIGISIAGILLTPQTAFLLHRNDPGEPEASSPYENAYNSMLDAKAAYDICGVYQLVFRDFWTNNIYPLTENYSKEMEKRAEQTDSYFEQQPPHQDNDMTGIFQGKNVVLVLMESMDDWLITEDNTPTLYRLTQEGIYFSQFYTPGYGSARTLNSEFCMNSGIYLPTSGSYVFDYLENSFDQSIANQFTASGYTAEVFHYNDPNFYSRGELEPALGYRNYNSFGEYEEGDALYNECILFDIPEMKNLFFRSGPTFNTYITRSAHMGYTYSERLSKYAFSQYPEYKGKYAGEYEDSARVKARLVDDFFQRLLSELDAQGQLENTVIIGMTDHYTYGYSDEEELMRFSGLEPEQSLLLENTPCFIWSADGPDITVTKTLNTADFVPTVLNLFGIRSPYDYLGKDAFDPGYPGYAIFPDGSWISDGVACQVDEDMEYQVILNRSGKALSREYLTDMANIARDFIEISNLLLVSDYYAKP